MRHLKKKRKLGRSASYRDAVVANLCISLIKHGRIRTTLAKAKLVRPLVEKLVTRAKTSSLHLKRIVARKLKSWEVIPKLFNTIGPKFKSRPGGYTRIIRLGFRGTDSAEIVQLEFLEEFKDVRQEQPAGKKEQKGGPKEALKEKEKPVKNIKDKKKA